MFECSPNMNKHSNIGHKCPLFGDPCLGVYQKKCLPYWSKDRICLIGDAAHATSPALGEGANQAMQDGYLVGKFLSEHLNPSDAFRQLYEFRHESTDAVIKENQ